MTAEQLKKDTENRLETIFHIRARFDDLAEHKRLCIIGESNFYHLISFQTSIKFICQFVVKFTDLKRVRISNCDF